MAEEVDYESDPEEAKLSLKMRRRVASDDEDEDGGGGEERGEKLVSRIDSDVESGEGEAADYDEDEEYLEEEEYFEDEGLLEVEGVYVEEMVEIPRGRKVDDVVGGYGEGGERLEVGVIEGNVNDGGKEWGDDGVGGEKEGEGEEEGEGEGEGEKKEQEPYAVPTAGAFYMHDDRFRDNARGGRHRYN